MIDDDASAASRIEEAIRERVPSTPADLHEAIATRLKDLPADGSDSLHRRPIGAVGATGGRRLRTIAAAVLLATGVVAAARFGRAGLVGSILPRPVRRVVPAPRSGAGAASR